MSRSNTTCLKSFDLCLLMRSVYKSSLPLHELSITWLWFLRPLLKSLPFGSGAMSSNVFAQFLA